MNHRDMCLQKYEIWSRSDHYCWFQSQTLEILMMKISGLICAPRGRAPYDFIRVPRIKSPCDGWTHRIVHELTVSRMKSLWTFFFFLFFILENININGFWWWCFCGKQKETGLWRMEFWKWVFRDNVFFKRKKKRCFWKIGFWKMDVWR